MCRPAHVAQNLPRRRPNASAQQLCKYVGGCNSILTLAVRSQFKPWRDLNHHRPQHWRLCSKAVSSSATSWRIRDANPGLHKLLDHTGAAAVKLSHWKCPFQERRRRRVRTEALEIFLPSAQKLTSGTGSYARFSGALAPPIIAAQLNSPVSRESSNYSTT